MKAKTKNTETETRPTVNESLRRSGTTGESWYVVLDAAKDATFLEDSAYADVYAESLYAGAKGAAYADVAPHLCALAPGGVLWKYVCHGWGASRSILFQTRDDFVQMRKHLRQFLLVSDPAGKKMNFRFYDPRVLRAFLRVCLNRINEDDAVQAPANTR